jgi:hypothetical protein
VIAGALLLLLLLAALIWWLLQPKPPAVIPAAVQAHHALDSLRQAPETGPVLSRVSQIIRGYFGKAFGLPGGELTTTEFCMAVGEQEEVGPELRREVGDFLRLCDERKFAPGAATEPLGAVMRADKLIDEAEARRAELLLQAQERARLKGNSS